MIIFEGMDHSGKSTAACAVATKMCLPMLHSPSMSVTEDPAHWHKWVQQHLDPEAPCHHLVPHMIYDRFPVISESIYGPVLRGRNICHKQYEEQLAELKPIIVYCRPPDEIIFQMSTEQMEGVEENKKTLLERYDLYMAAIANYVGVKVIRYDWTKSAPPVPGWIVSQEALVEFLEEA